MDWLDETRFADIHTFVYSGMRFDPTSGVAEFDFVHEGSAQRLCFTEVLEFPLPAGGLDPAVSEPFARVLELLYVAVGTVYYKTVAPEAVVVDSVPLSPAAARWAEQLYRQGLAEFAYRWTLQHVLDLPVRTHYRAPAGQHHDHAASGRGPLVAMGGGRDSLVTLEALTSAGFRPATFVVKTREPTTALTELMAGAPGPALPIRRRPDPVMKRMLAENALRVGHVPYTAINMVAGIALAVLHGLGPVVMANERSADEGNMTWAGRPVNHQWSKSLDAEQLLTDAVREHAGIGTACFSLLRGMSELTISRLFAATTTYDPLLASCNVAALTRARDGSAPRWCNDCPKCRFVFVGLAPFMDPPRLVRIFGRDLLADPTQVAGYRELVGLGEHKPFECVGEVAEARVAVATLAADSPWQDAAVIADLAARLPPIPESTTTQVWRIDPAHGAPPAYRHAVER